MFRPCAALGAISVMAFSSIVDEICPLLCQHVDMDSLLQFAISSRCCHQFAARSVEILLAHDYRGIELRHPSPRCSCSTFASCSALGRALWPRVLLKGYCEHWPWGSLRFPVLLNSEGPLFWSCAIVSSCAPNGTPTIGLVDGGIGLLPSQPGALPMDFSRQQLEVPQKNTEAVFAISCSVNGRMHAMLPPSCDQRLQGDSCEWIHRQDMPAHCKLQGTHVANLGWEWMGDETMWNDIPIHVGFFLHQRMLRFYRFYQPHGSRLGHWQDGCVVCENLPTSVVPCVFMFSFEGFAQVQFTGVRHNPPGTSCVCGPFEHY